MKHPTHTIPVLAAVLLAATPAFAGSHSSQSAAFRVDTRATTAVKVADVSSRYCHGAYGAGGKSVCFLDGVALPVEFTAKVDWGGKSGSRLEFNGANNGLNYKKSLDVGGLGAGGKLEVVAVATDGTRSGPFRANFDVVPWPPLPGFYPQVLAVGSDLSYTSPQFDIDVFKGRSGVVQGCPLPGKTMDIQPRFTAEGTFTGDGQLTVKAAAGNRNTIKLNGTQGRRPDGKFGKAAAVDFGLDVEGEVVAVWRRETGAWAVSSGYLGLSGYGSWSSPPYYVYAPPPIYLRAEVGGSVSVGVRVKDLGTGQGWTPQFSLRSDGLPDVKGVLGCGVGKVLALEGYVGVNGVMEFVSPPTVCEKLGVEGKIGAQIVVFGFATAPIDIWSGTYWIVGGDGATGLALPLSAEVQQTLRLTSLDTRQFAQLPRAYLGRLKPLAPPTGRMVPLTGGTESVLVADGYPYPAPAMAVAGGRRHVLYLRDNPGRSAENRTELVEVNSDGGAWSAPVAVWDDGTGDFTPEVATLADGTLLAAWANGNAALTNNAPLDDALRTLEIATAERNPATGAWTHRNLTANAWLDHSPALSAVPDGRAMLVWLRNRDLNPTGNPEQPNRILFARRQGGVWSEEDYVAVNLGTITCLAVAYDGAQATLVFAMDADGDLSTPDDQELYGCTFNGSQWGPYTRLTFDELQDTRPHVVYDALGNLLLVWYQNGIVKFDTDLDLADAATVGEVGIGTSAQDFQLVTGPAGQLAVVWQDLANDGAQGHDPFVLNYDPALRIWSRGVRLLEDASLEREFAGVFGPDGHLLLAYGKVDVDADMNGVPLFGAVDLCFLDHPVGPDPAIPPDGIALSTNAVDFGEDVTVSVTVVNRGDLPVANLAVCVWDGDPLAGGTLIGTTQRVEQVLIGGTSAVVNVTWALPASGSNVVLYAMADPGLETADRNRANNLATLAALMPDLTLDSATVFNESTNARLLKATVLNAGAVPAPAGVVVTFRRGAPDGALLDEQILGALAPGTNGIYDAGFRWDQAGLIFTSAFEVVYIAVDPTNAVTEVDERDNTAAVQVMTSLDSDGDGLLDGEEVRLGTDPLLADTDGDGLTDAEEVLLHGTNPLLADTDGDGASDDDEVAAGTDPHSASDVFKIVAADGSVSYRMGVTWSAKSGKSYRVRAASAVVGPWADAPDNGGLDGQSLRTAVTNGPLRYIDYESAPEARFYKVNLSP